MFAKDTLQKKKKFTLQFKELKQSVVQLSARTVQDLEQDVSSQQQ